MAADSVHIPSGYNEGDSAMQPPWLAPYAERLYHRFPELFFALGDPMLPQAFQLPATEMVSPHGSISEVYESSYQKVVRVTLRRHTFSTGVNPQPPHRLQLDPPCSTMPWDGGYAFPFLSPTLPSQCPEAVDNALAAIVQNNSSTARSTPSYSMAPGGQIMANSGIASTTAPSATSEHSIEKPFVKSADNKRGGGGGTNGTDSRHKSSKIEPPVASKHRETAFSATFHNALDSSSKRDGIKPASGSHSESSFRFRQVDSRTSTGLPSRGSKESLGAIRSDDDGLSASSLELPPARIPMGKQRSLPCQLPSINRSVSWQENIDGMSTDTSSQSLETSLASATRTAFRFSDMSDDAPRRSYSSSAVEPADGRVLLLTTMRKRASDSGIMADKVHSVLSSGSASPSSSQSPANSRRASLQNRRGLQLTLPVGQGEEEGRDSPSISSPESSLVLPLSAINTIRQVTTSPVRGMSSPVWRMAEANKFASGGGFCKIPERITPAVRLQSDDFKFGVQRSNSGHGAVHRPFPGAFPHRRTIFFLDWDDTLCPTSWIRSHLKAHIADTQEWAEELQHSHIQDFYHSIPGWFSHPLPDLPHVHEMILDLQSAIINFITRAQAHGIVCIVTNAVEGWVERTIKKWLPKLKPYIFGHGYRPEIRVIYGQKVYKEPSPKLEDLPWVDELGPYMWWKKAAMTIALDEIDELYRLPHRGSAASLEEGEVEESEDERFPSIPWYAVGDSKHIANVISIGDNDAEMQAPELAAITHEERRFSQFTEQNLRIREGAGIPASTASASRPSPWPWIKRIKLRTAPHAQQLITQLEEMVELLPQVVALRRHFQVNLGQEEEIDDHRLDDFRCKLEPRPLSELCSNILLCSEEDLTVERALRTQSV